MTSGAIVTMIVLVGIAWGGFGYCLLLAMKKERLKTRLHKTEKA